MATKEGDASRENRTEMLSAPKGTEHPKRENTWAQVAMKRARLEEEDAIVIKYPILDTSLGHTLDGVLQS